MHAFWSMWLQHYLTGCDEALCGDDKALDDHARKFGYASFDAWLAQARLDFDKLQAAGNGLHCDDVADVEVHHCCSNCGWVANCCELLLLRSSRPPTCCRWRQVWHHLKDIHNPPDSVPKAVSAFWDLTSLYVCQLDQTDKWLSGCALVYGGVPAWRHLAKQGYKRIVKKGLAAPPDVAVPSDWDWLFTRYAAPQPPFSPTALQGDKIGQVLARIAAAAIAKPPRRITDTFIVRAFKLDPYNKPLLAYARHILKSMRDLPHQRRAAFL